MISIASRLLPRKIVAASLVRTTPLACFGINKSLKDKDQGEEKVYINKNESKNGSTQRRR